MDQYVLIPFLYSLMKKVAQIKDVIDDNIDFESESPELLNSLKILKLYLTDTILQQMIDSTNNYSRKYCSRV